MSNQTFEERLVKDCLAEPLEGHNVVVFERVGETGEKFRTILPPGTPLKRGLLDRLWPQGRFFAVAVDASPELHLDVKEHVVLEDEVAHRFELLMDLYYSVSDPHLLASLRNRDPLGVVADRARQVLRRDVKQMQWTEVVFAFAVSGQEVLRQRLPELRAFAAGYGIALRSVEMERLLPEQATGAAAEEERELDKIQRGERIAVAGMDSARRIGEAASLHALGSADLEAAAQEVRDAARIRAAAVDGRIRAIGTVAGEVSTADEFRTVFQGGIHPGGAAGTTASMLPGAGTPPIAALTAGTGGLSALLQQVVSATQNVSGSGRRLELRSALLHLVAEVLLEDLGEPATRTRYADRARELFGTLERSLAPCELDTLRALSDPVELEKALRG